LGAVGELCLGGVLARGYAGRPAATAEAFLPDAYSSEPGARLYRTGDRARWLGVGEGARLQVLGRLDDPVKVRGFRVEPAEVARALESLTGVAEAVVVTRRGPAGTELAAFVTGSAGFGGLSGGQALRREVAAKLPAHLVPATVEVVDRLPRTVTGKVDRRALLLGVERLTARGPAPGAAGDAPRTGVEAEVAAVAEDSAEVGATAAAAVLVAAPVEVLAEVVTGEVAASAEAVKGHYMT
jgi:acyl-coenzyme A synthetase/AMP-(fatty) acid ligase